MQNAVGRKAQAGAKKHRFVIKNLRKTPESKSQILQKKPKKGE